MEETTDSQQNLSDYEMVVSHEMQTDRGETPPLLNHGHTCHKLPFYVVFASVVAAIGGILFGYDIGIIAGALIQLRHKDVFSLTCLDQELVVGSMLVGSVIGAAAGGFLTDQFGRRRMILVNGFLFISGGLILSLATSFTVLIVGRVLVGVAVSISAIVDCIYISEISPPKERGMLVSLNELAITLGMLVAYLVNYLFIDTPHGWRYMFGLSIIPCIIQLSIMIFLPESPRHHALKGQYSQAEQVLIKFRQTPDVRTELNDIKAAIASDDGHGILELFSRKDNMCGRLSIAVGIVFLQQMTGEPNVLLYAPTLLASFGFTSSSSQTLATVGLGVVKLLSTFVAVMLLDRVGRRRLLMVGAFLMALSAACVTGVTWVGQGQLNPVVCSDNATDIANASYRVTDTSYGHMTSIVTETSYSAVNQYIALVALLVYVMAYSFSFATGAWLIMSEIFPSAVRGRGMAIAMVVNGLTNALVSFTFLTLVDAIHIYSTFLIYTCVCLFSVILIFIFIPETKNRSLEQISADLQHSSLKTRVKLAGSFLKRLYITRSVPVGFFSPQRYYPVRADDVIADDGIAHDVIADDVIADDVIADDCLADDVIADYGMTEEDNLLAHAST